MDIGSAEKLINALKQLDCPAKNELEILMFDHFFDNPVIGSFLNQFTLAVEAKELLSSTENKKEQTKTQNELEREKKTLEFEENNKKAKEANVDELKRQLYQLSVHKLALEKKSKLLENAKNEREKNLQLNKENANQSNLQYISDLNKLVSSVKRVQPDNEENKNGNFLKKKEAHVDTFIKDYLTLEQTHLKDLQGYIKKQFRKQIGAVASSHQNENSIVTLNTTDPTWQNMEETNPVVNKWKEETARLKDCLLTTQKLIYKAKKAEAGHTSVLTYLNQELKEKHLTSLSNNDIILQIRTINEKTENAECQLKVFSVETDLKSHQMIEDLISHVFKGNYDLKMKQHGYFLAKQDQLLEFLINQMNRLSFLHILLQIEIRKRRELRNVVTNLAEELKNESIDLIRRKKRLISVQTEDNLIISNTDDIFQQSSNIIGKDEEMFFTTYEYIVKRADNLKKQNQKLNTQLESSQVKITDDLNLARNDVASLMKEIKFTLRIDSCLGVHKLKQNINSFQCEIVHLQKTVERYNNLFKEKVKTNTKKHHIV